MRKQLASQLITVGLMFLMLITMMLVPGRSNGQAVPATVHAPDRLSLAGELWNGVFALYGTIGTVTHFVCTSEVIGKIPGGYRLLSAGHCVQEIPDHVGDNKMVFSVSEEIGSPMMPVTMVKAYEGDGLDFSIFDLKTTKTYPVLKMGTESDLAVGDKVIDVHFALGLVKQLATGVVASMPIQKSERCTVDGCVNKIIVPMSTGPGASGSAVVSTKTHKIVGLVITQFGRVPTDMGVEPISLFAKFMAGPNQPHPVADGEDDVRIAVTDFQKYFGAAHPFTLGMHGPNPVFGLGGYTFQVNTGGFELSDEYYYDVPVFIDYRYGRLSLVSTKGGYSVGVAVVAKPN